MKNVYDSQNYLIWLRELRKVLGIYKSQKLEDSGCKDINFTNF